MTTIQKLKKFIDHTSILSQKGFSLVEMAVVLVIIGLITGSVLKGQQLIENAKLTTIVSQVRTYETACQIFSSTYNALPGDFNQATEMIDSSLTNGDGNRIIEGSGFDGESLQFWLHLSKANLLSGIPPLSGIPDFGNGIPATKFGGGITVVKDEGDVGSHWFVIGAKSDGAGRGALFTPQQAHFIVQKLSGSDVEAREGVGASGTCLTDAKLNLTNKKPACIIYVKL